jgi:hypothetical protein
MMKTTALRGLAHYDTRASIQPHNFDVPLAIATLNARHTGSLVGMPNPLDKHAIGAVKSLPVSTDVQNKRLEDKLPAWITELKTRRAELQRELGQVQQALDGLEKLLVLGATKSSSSSGDPSESAQVRFGLNGLPEGVSRRQALWEIILEFGNIPFDSKELRERLLDKYPQAQTKSLPQSVTNLLRDMSDKGQIKRLGRRGDGPTDPFIYQHDNDREESLDLGA